MSEYKELCNRLREMYIRDGTDYVQRAADLIEILEEENERLYKRYTRLDEKLYLEEQKTAQLTAQEKEIQILLAERDKLVEQNTSLFDAALLAAQERDAARRAALEEAAKVCEELRRPAGWSAESGDWVDGTLDCAKAIRALIDQE